MSAILQVACRLLRSLQRISRRNKHAPLIKCSRRFLVIPWSIYRRLRRVTVLSKRNNAMRCRCARSNVVPTGNNSAFLAFRFNMTMVVGKDKGVLLHVKSIHVAARGRINKGVSGATTSHLATFYRVLRNDGISNVHFYVIHFTMVKSKRNKNVSCGVQLCFLRGLFRHLTITCVHASGTVVTQVEASIIIRKATHYLVERITKRVVRSTSTNGAINTCCRCFLSYR